MSPNQHELVAMGILSYPCFNSEFIIFLQYFKLIIFFSNILLIFFSNCNQHMDYIPLLISNFEFWSSITHCIVIAIQIPFCIVI